MDSGALCEVSPLSCLTHSIARLKMFVICFHKSIPLVLVDNELEQKYFSPFVYASK